MNIKEMSINEFKKEVEKFFESKTSDEILDELKEYEEEQE